MYPTQQLRRPVARLTRRALGGVALALCLSAGALGGTALLQACGSDETGGRRVALDTRIALEADGTTFQTAAGWSVTLSKALLATGPLYYFDGAPPLVELRRPRPWQFASRWLGVRSAHAHPGHYVAGKALGQMLEPWSVDLLAGAVDLPAGEGVTGVYRSARFSFAVPPAGPMAGDLEGHVAIVEGRAEKAGQMPRVFRAVADLTDVERSAAFGQVEGCEFSELDVEANGFVTVRVQPRVWFELVDFAQLDAGSEQARVEFPADSQPKIAFAQGLAQLSAYKFSYSTE